jgi:hypothetical protein
MTIMILYRLRLVSLLGLVSLGSCISVNNVGMTPNQPARDNPRAVQIEDQAEEIAEQNPVATIEASGHSCQLYKLPPLPPKPQRPIAQIAALKDGDDQKLDQIAQNYVRALENYNTKVAAAIDRSYAEYVAMCVKSIPVTDIRAPDSQKQ